MNIEFSRITPNLKLDGTDPVHADNVANPAAKAVESLFADSLVVKESENFSFGGMDEIDMDEVEKELVRDDRLGKLFSSQFDFEPPEMPVFV